MFDKAGRTDGIFARDFTYDYKADAYIFPTGKQLLKSRRAFQTIRQKPKDTGFAKYGALKADCDACALKEKCFPKNSLRRTTVSEFEGARQMARDIAKTQGYAISCKLRKNVEMLFAHLKRILGLRRLRLRGPNGANDEFLLAATAQNPRKLAKLFPVEQTTKAA
ncbi:hypothetical protein IWQ49_006745 [Labrenzia sp. EL_126]|nr:hypothetical protein [Labrenzia sp. EL_126]